MASVNDIQNLYIAYFNRPADVAGLAYWTSGPQANFTALQIAQSFSEQVEYAGIFSGVSTKKTINALFNNLFNHDADPAGLAYWTGQIDNGTLTIGQAAIAILAGATGTDAVCVAAKFAAATSFTNKMAANTSLQAVYSQTNGHAFHLAKAWLAGITDAFSSAAATATLDATFAAMPDPTALPIVVQPGVANQGTSGNDTFKVTNDTLSASGTSITGNGGNDVLVLTTAFSGISHPAYVIGVSTLELDNGAFMIQGADPFMNQFSTINYYNCFDSHTLLLGRVVQTLNLYQHSGDTTVVLGAPNQTVRQVAMGSASVNIASTNANLVGATFDLSPTSDSNALYITDAGTASLSAAQLKDFHELYLRDAENLTLNPATGIYVNPSQHGNATTITEGTGAGAIGINITMVAVLTLNTSASHATDVNVAPFGFLTLALVGTGNVVVKVESTGIDSSFTLTLTGSAGLETINLPASSYAVNNIAVTGSTIGNIASSLVTINNFKASSGTNVLHTGASASSLGNINIATSDFNSLAGNIASGAGALANNDYKAFIVNVAGGAAAGTYVYEHTAGTTVGAGDIIVKLTGSTGTLLASDLQM